MHRDQRGALRRRLPGLKNEAHRQSEAERAADKRWIARRTLVTLGLFGLVIGASLAIMKVTPSSFVPDEDQGAVFALVQLPEGVKFLPFMVPGSEELMSNNVAGLRDHQIVLWAKHGVMARSDVSPLGACDKIEYAETGALYEYKNLATGGRAQGLSDDELHRVVEAFNVPTTLF